MANIVVVGWGEKGPAVEVRTRRNGFRNRRSRHAVQFIGRKMDIGASHPHPAHDEVDGSLLFNKGFVYNVHLSIDGGDVEVANVDASEKHRVLPLAFGVELVQVDVVGGGEDGQLAVREAGGDEEE